MRHWIADVLRVCAWRRLLATAWAAACVALPFSHAAAAGAANGDLRVTFQGIIAVTDLKASSGPAVGQITLRWTAPAYSGSSLPLSYDIRVATYANISNDAELAAAGALASFSTVTAPSVGVAGSSQALILTGLDPAKTHCFALRARDSGAPSTAGGWRRSVSRGMNVFNCSLGGSLETPLEPFGLKIQAVSSATVNLSWVPTGAYRSGVSFFNPSAPTSVELVGYKIYRATGPITGPWTLIGGASTGTWTYGDSGSGEGYFYHVRAENAAGLSEPSVSRAYSGYGSVANADGSVQFDIPGADLDRLAGETGNAEDAWRVTVTSKAVDSDARTLRSFSVEARKGGTVADPNFRLTAGARLRLSFSTQDGSVVPSGLSPRAATVAPDQMSVYWFNGNRWFQLYGKLDALAKTMSIETQYLGDYQLRTVERLSGFNFDASGLTNRLLTPNGDGKNDFITFVFDNPRDSAVSGKIMDLKGAVVASMVPGTVSNSLVWDGKSGGRVVASGMYLYQIEAEGKVFNGAVVVVK